MRTKFFPFVCAGLAAMVALTSCGGQKQVVNSGKTEVIMPFSTPEYRTDANYFRAAASGTSKDMEMARTAAELNARSALATQIEVVVKSVTDRYMNQYDVNGESEVRGKIETGVREVVNQTLKGAVIKDTKLYQNPDGSYEYWACIEMSKVPVAEGVEDVLISNDERISVDFDQYRFMKTFEEEMANYGKENK